MLLDAGTSTWLADAAILLDGADAAIAATTSVAADAAAVAAETPADPSWFDSLIVFPFEFVLTTLHDLLKGAGVQEAWGPSIIGFTIAVKLLTFPLTKVQIESTTKMQAIAPAAKVLQEKYKERDPARLNSELQKLYQDNQVNPLAGCIPAIAQIPLFIGLYRSLLNLANDDVLSESFLFLPSLEGPVRSYTEGIGWLTEWQNGAPRLGWTDTLSYLVLPVVLVASQYASTALLTPKTDDPAQAQSQQILKFLPLMIGWFSLSVPSGLGLYWLTNNVVTTVTTLAIRATVETPDLVTAGAPAAPVDPKPAGFGRKYGEIIETTGNDGTKTTIRPPGATKKERRAAAAAAQPGASAASVLEAGVVDVAAGAAATPDGSVEDASSTSAKKKRAKAKKGGKRKK
jgi:YidC/Oxa1 family membrane protein insertase